MNILRISATAVVIGFAFTGGVSCSSLLKPKTQVVRTTAYTHTEADHIEYENKSAAGTRLRGGGPVRSAAADWSKYPLGTKFKIVGSDYVYEIDDYGSALVGTETIDLYRPSKRAMNRWGMRHVKIKVLKWGCFDKSLEVMKGRTHAQHVRQMVQKIQEST